VRWLAVTSPIGSLRGYGLASAIRSPTASLDEAVWHRIAAMKKTPPVLLPKDFPLHAPLPPGGPWIRPAREEDWQDEVTVALAPPSETTGQRPAPESGVRASRGPGQPRSRSGGGRPISLGLGLAPSLTPLALVEADAVLRKRSA
jgi:hypothetical protein